MVSDLNKEGLQRVWRIRYDYIGGRERLAENNIVFLGMRWEGGWGEGGDLWGLGGSGTIAKRSVFFVNFVIFIISAGQVANIYLLLSLE